MENSQLLRCQMIGSVLDQATAPVPEAAIAVWEAFAAEIISLVGEGGFSSIYARSLHLAEPAFPWLAASILSPQSQHRFGELKLSLEAQTPAQAGEANRLLLITFTDILASLIGEQLTVSILRSTWGNSIADKVGKEFGIE